MAFDPDEATYITVINRNKGQHKLPADVSTIDDDKIYIHGISDENIELVVQFGIDYLTNNDLPKSYFRKFKTMMKTDEENFLELYQLSCTLGVQAFSDKLANIIASSLK